SGVGARIEAAGVGSESARANAIESTTATYPGPAGRYARDPAWNSGPSRCLTRRCLLRFGPMNRYALAGLLALPLACASSPGRASNGELYLEVETTTALGYVEFINHETGNAARAVAIPEGTSEHTVSVRAGEWCLFEVSLGMGAVGHA